MRESYENALIVLLIFGITWIMFLYWNKSSKEGFNLYRGYIKKTDVAKNYISNDNVIKNYISSDVVKRDYKKNDVVDRDYKNNDLIKRDYVDKTTYDSVNYPIIIQQRVNKIISNYVLFSSNVPGKSINMYIAEKEIVTDLSNNPSLTNAKVSYEDINERFVIYFNDIPNCLQLKKYNIVLSQGDKETTYYFSDYSEPICGLTLNKGPYKLKLFL